jgi:hypothetical protein
MCYLYTLITSGQISTKSCDLRPTTRRRSLGTNSTRSYELPVAIIGEHTSTNWTLSCKFLILPRTGNLGAHFNKNCELPFAIQNIHSTNEMLYRFIWSFPVHTNLRSNNSIFMRVVKKNIYIYTPFLLRWELYHAYKQCVIICAGWYQISGKQTVYVMERYKVKVKLSL